LVFSKLGEKDTPELVRMASLTETMAEPLVDFQPLLIYARGMKKFVCGDLEAAKVEFDKALTEKNEIIVADINLPIPEQIAPPKTQQNKNLSRRRVIQYLGWGGVGLGLTAGGAYFFSSRDNLQTSEFEVVTVDARGNITNRRRSQAKFFVEDLGNGVLLNMVEIPGATFAMGSPPNEAGRSGDEGPQHQVTVPRFFMGRYEVTQSQYEAIMENNPSNFKDNGANRPVETVSWNDAVEFCKRLSQKTGNTYRLPSEAEWEYACRAGTSTPFHFGETITADLANYHSEVAYASAPTKKARGQTTPVGSFSANAFGLYDMHGNVWEWCQDIWHDNYKGAPVDGSPWLTGLNTNITNTTKLFRGGSWNDDPVDCRSASRDDYYPVNRNDYFGFRVVMVPE
jgi:formylglycine-generating enzyme required for sulfatase activity